MMVGSKATRFVVHREAAATVVAQVAKDPPPLPQSDGDQVLVDYPSTHHLRIMFKARHLKDSFNLSQS